jgi:hypothetical protein
MERRHAMMTNSALYFGMRAWRLPPRRTRGAKLKRSPPFSPEGHRGQPTFVGFRSPCRSERSRPVRAEISFFPPKVSSPALNPVSRPCFIFGSPRFVFYGRGGAVAMVNNNTPRFGSAARFSRPKWRKSDQRGGRLKPAPEV